MPALAVAFFLASRWAGVPRPFLDAYVPPAPYRWVSPPPEGASQNQPPSGGETVIAFAQGRSDPASAFTDDGQVTVSFNAGTFPLLTGQTGVRVRIAPVRPQPAAPAEVVSDGNAYLIEATYVPSGQPVGSLIEPALIDLRYPAANPEAIYRIDGGSWTPIGGTVQELLLTIDARSSQLGTFAAGHRPAQPSSGTGAGTGAALLGAVLIVGLLSLLLVVLLLAGGFRIRGHRPQRAGRGKPPRKRDGR